MSTCKALVVLTLAFLLGCSAATNVLYATTSENKAYFKPFNMESQYGFDEFGDAVQQSLLHDIGTADWYILSAELPI